MNSPARVLVIDDEPDNFDVIETLLYDEGYQLDYAPNGRVALEHLELFQPDAIVLDVMMPEIDGITVCQKIKAQPQWQGVPVVMVTALTEKEDLARCLAAGADDFISKPVDGLELRARVRSMLRLKQHHDGLQTALQLQTNTVNLLQSNLDELRGTMARAMPHELNTPLNGMFGALDLLLLDHDDMSSQERQELLELARQSAGRLDRLSQRFLTYVQLELTTNRLVDPQLLKPPEPLPLAELITITAERQAKVAGRRDDLICDVEPCTAQIKSKDFCSALEELIENAFKFSPAGSVVRVAGRSHRDCVEITIVDRGRGMSDQEIQRIGAFVQFDRRTQEQQGLGLGLAIASKVTRLYGGTMMLDNKTAGELTVRLILPT